MLRRRERRRRSRGSLISSAPRQPLEDGVRFSNFSGFGADVTIEFFPLAIERCVIEVLLDEIGYPRRYGFSSRRFLNSRGDLFWDADRDAPNSHNINITYRRCPSTRARRATGPTQGSARSGSRACQILSIGWLPQNSE